MSEGRKRRSRRERIVCGAQHAAPSAAPRSKPTIQTRKHPKHTNRTHLSEPGREHDGKAPVDPWAKARAMKELEEGGDAAPNPNAGLLRALKAYGEECFAAASDTGE